MVCSRWQDGTSTLLDLRDRGRHGLLGVDTALCAGVAGLLDRESDRFQVDWVGDIVNVYRTRLEFKNAALLVDPKHTCQ